MSFEPHEPEFLTRTETAKRDPDSDGTCLGILWLTPEERFHELAHAHIIGRAEGSSLRLEGPSVSRQHARIERDGPLWLLRDLGSKNGSFINAARRELGPLGLQDTLRLGDWVGVVCRMPKAAVAEGRYFRELVPAMTLSAATLAGFARLPALAMSDVPIIIRGETGTGKERLAHAIHQLSQRPGDLVAINCSAIPEALAEAELFGHKKGAFTGASEASAGRIVAARGGSLLLDEIVDLPMNIQSKLLRALEERAVTPVGTSQVIPVDFRLIAASQARLDALVLAGGFRGDLYARLNGAEIELPPLRQRREEVLRLMESAMAAALGERPVFESQFAERLCAYDWPYNVRELLQLARLLCVSRKTHFSLADLPQRFLESGAPGQQLEAAGDDGLARTSRRQLWLSRYAIELGQLKRAMQECGGNVTEAARQSGIPRHRARRLLEAEAALARGVERGV